MRHQTFYTLIIRFPFAGLTSDITITQKLQQNLLVACVTFCYTGSTMVRQRHQLSGDHGNMRTFIIRVLALLLVFLGIRKIYYLSIEAMQSFDLPTVGGTISVNAHGLDHRIGGIASTIQSLRLMLADGSIQSLSRRENTELFQAVVGGYGLFGIILDVQLSLMDNLAYREVQTIMKTQEFPTAYTAIVNNPSYHMFYARLSDAPSSFLKETIIYAYKVVDQSLPLEPLKPEKLVKLSRFVFNL